MPHISIKAETLFTFLGFPITNSMLTIWVVMVIFVLLFRTFALHLTQKDKSTFFHILYLPVSFIYDTIRSVLHEKTKFFFPLLGALFFYILLNNWFALLPGVGSILLKPVHEVNAQRASMGVVETGEKVPLFRAGFADLNATLALAIVIMVCVQYFGIKSNGKEYGKKFFNFASPVAFFVGILELISELARILSFSFRLFGNVFAGEVLLTIVAFLIPFAISFPFVILEIFAGGVQAFVFVMIGAVLLSMATAKTHH